MDRRHFLRLSGGAALLSLGLTLPRVRGLAAQEAGPFAGLGLPELAVTVSESGFTLSATETPAGWTLVTFEIDAPPQANANCDFMLLPADVTVEEATTLLSSPNSDAPEWYFETMLAGGPSGFGGSTIQSVVNLAQPGTWILFSGGEGLPPASLTVTGEATTAAAPAIEATVDIGFVDFSFTGLDAPLPAGPHIWRFTNEGEQPHHMAIWGVPDGSTADQVVGAFVGAFSGTPVPGALSLDQFGGAGGGCGDLSPGGISWHALDYAAGTYGAVCFVPDKETGMPHLLHGMAAVFTVA